MPASSPKLDHFQSLVTSVAALSRSVDALASAPLPEVSEAQAQAWRALTRPERVFTIALQNQLSAGAELNAFHAHYRGHGTAAQNARFFPLLSDQDCSLIAQGLADCVAQAKALIASDAFAKAAALQAPLIVSPGGSAEAPELAYPLMGLSLKAGRTTIDNKRAETLVGHPLARAGDIHFSTYDRYRQGAPASPAVWLAGQNTPDPDALSALTAARKASPDYSSDAPAQFLRFGAVLRSEAPPELSADLPLPSVSLIRERAPKAELSARGSWAHLGSSREGGSRADLAASQAAHAALAIQSMGALSALSLALSARQEMPLAERLATRRRAGSPPAHAAQARASQPLLESNSRSGGINMYLDRARAQAFYELARDARAGCLPVTDEDLDHKLSPFLLPAPKTAPDPNAHRNRGYGYGYDEPVPVVAFGELGTGFSGLSKALSGADARLGLIQFALSSSSFDTDIAQEALPQMLPERAALLGAMLDLRSALEEGQRLFLDKALAAAESIEADWMRGQNLLPVWRQAHSSGSISARSIAWAKLNPASALLTSENPMEAVGARVAKAWGLRLAQVSDEAFLPAFEQALAERGGQRAAWDAFAANADLRERLAQLTAATATVDKALASTARGALAFYIRAVERSASLGMDPEEINRFTRAYIEPESPPSLNHDYYRRRAEGLTFVQRLGSLPYFGTLGSIAQGSWDGLSPGLGATRVSTGPAAELARDLNLGKAAQYDAMIDALARDWSETVDSCVAHGQTPQAAEPVARARASELAYAFPASGVNAFDWRQPVFSELPAWRALGLPSPRYSAAANAANAQGPLGAWCAAVARDLDIRDAHDGNDLIGQTRDAVKRATDLTDFAWRQIIKQPEAMEYLRANLGAKASAVAPERRLSEADQGAVQAARATANFEPQAAQEARQKAALDLRARDAGRLFSMASTLNLPLDKALRAGRALPEDLFGSTIGSLELAGADGARFYLNELSAKRERAPWILKEAVKRLEALDKAAEKPVAEGHTRQTAAQAFSAETTDLADWIKNSEPGLWQELPAIPTWNQLRRASAEWHEEQAAIARDKNERRMAREAKEAANEILLHAEDAAGEGAVKVGARNLMGEFANPSGSSWPKALGRYATDGWEAIELLTASQLTEEGAAMSHCVSSYSGQCRSGQTRIFSIRLNGERVCTLQISGKAPLAKLDEKASFDIVQNKGKHNAAVTSNAALTFCGDTLAAFSASWSAMCLKRRELIAAEIARQKAEAAGEAAPKAKARKPKGA